MERQADNDTRNTKAIVKVTRTRAAVAVVTAILMAWSPAQLLADQPLALNVSWSLGPLATTVNITPPAMVGTAGMYQSTIHIHASDNIPQPPFNTDLIAIGQAPYPTTLLGGLIPATVIVKRDLLKGSTFQSAAADAFSQTGVTVTLFQDASLVEYGLLVGLIAVILMDAAPSVEPTLGPQAGQIKNTLMNYLCTTDLTSIGGSQGVCPTTIP